MRISIDNVRLAFPLDLALGGMEAIDGGDTLLAAEALRLKVRVKPLFHQVIDLNGFELWRAHIDSKSFISDTRIKGDIGLLEITEPSMVNLSEKSVDVNRIKLDRSNVRVLLSDTAKEDTTKHEPTRWKIKVGRANINRTGFFVRMPGDSMRLSGNLTEVKIDRGDFDLGKKNYSARKLRIKASELNYDIPQSANVKGFDSNHINVTGMVLQADTLRYAGHRLSVGIPLFTAKEKCGLTITRLRSRVTLDSTHLYLPEFHLRTPYTNLAATANMDWKALKVSKGGKMDFKVEGYVGSKDLCVFAGKAAKQIQLYLPNNTVQIDARAEGNMDFLKISRLKATIPGFISLKVDGNIGRITSDKRRFGLLNYKIQTFNITPFYKLLPSGVRKSVSIPHRMSLTGKVNFTGNRYGTNSLLYVGHGNLKVNGQFDAPAQAYKAKMTADRFPLYLFLPKDSLSAFTGKFEAEGKGFDFLSAGTRVKARGDIHHFSYGKTPLDTIRFDALLRGGHANVNLIAQNKMLVANTNLKAEIFKRQVKAAMTGTVEKLDLVYVTHGKDSVQFMAELDVKGNYAPSKHAFGVTGELKNINIMTSKMGYPGDDVRMGFKTQMDSTRGYVSSGDLQVHFQANSSFGQITKSLSLFASKLAKQIKAAHLDKDELSRDLPNMNLYVQAGKRNPLSQLLSFRGYDTDSFSINLSTRQNVGLYGDMYVWAFKTGDLLLDKTTLHINQDTAGVHLNCNIDNMGKKNPNRFKANVEGTVLANSFSAKARYTDEQNVEGLNVGVRAQLSTNGDITYSLFPEHSVIAYRKFTVNKDNFLTFGKDHHISADVNLLADDRTGIKILTPEGDSTRDVTISLNRINLKELSSVLPFLPQLGGMLSGDVHAGWKDKELSAVAEMNLDNFHYEGCELGNMEVSCAFLPNGNKQHYVAAEIASKERKVLDLSGVYADEDGGSIDMDVNLTDFPSNMLNGFMSTDGTIGLSGDINGALNVSGPVSKFLINGQLMPDSLHVLSALYGINLSLENKEIDIKDSKLHLDNLSMYSISENPLVANGDVDFSNFNSIRLNLAFNAKNFEVINSPQTKQSVVFGNVYSDIDATLKGTTDLLIMRGTLNVLDNTNMTYVMKDSPLTVEDRLNGLVDFVDFTDTTHVKKESVAPPGGVFVGLNIHISNSAELHCKLSEDGSSYFNCNGGGNLDMKYFPNGEIFLTGRFSMSEGEMKYALPFIPLKTFNLSGDDNYIGFTGEPFNPTLHITAMEKTRASVSDDNSSTRMVSFNVGVAITQNLENMGLQFLVEAPEDMYVQNELASMSKEERGKVAVSLLATGMYFTSSNKSNFKANNALNAFLQSEIQNIAGNALKTIDLSVGVEGSTSASGNAQTDYSFQFAKHLWNDRVTFKIGGKVTAGSEAMAENQSFIDNISLEYRVGKGSSRNLRLFYDHDTVDPLEGTYSTAGGGLVLRKKTKTFGEIFLFRNPRRKEKKAPMPTNASKN